MILAEMLKQMRALDPIPTLIDTTLEYDYLTDYKDNANAIDAYYMGIKYANLETVTDDIEGFLALVDVAIANNNYKWTKLYATTQLEYDPIANVDATIVEERDIASRHSEDTIGGANVTTTNSQAPMESSNFHNQTQSETASLEHTDEHDEDAYKDTITTTRQGNIGVTSTQQLIEAERATADFKFLDILMADVINFLTYPYYGG